jgi:hypothetical protein
MKQQWASNPLRISWGLALMEILSGMTEDQLIVFDKKCAAIMYPAAQYPQYVDHTLSWIWGQEENAGDLKAKLMCDFLAVLLGAGHCQIVLSLPPE